MLVRRGIEKIQRRDRIGMQEGGNVGSLGRVRLGDGIHGINTKETERENNLFSFFHTHALKIRTVIEGASVSAPFLCVYIYGGAQCSCRVEFLFDKYNYGRERSLDS